MRHHVAVGLVALSVSATVAPAQVAKDDRGLEPVAEAARRFDRGRQWAVVIGIDHYDDKTIRPLQYAVEDAQLVAGVMTEKCGYPVGNVLVMTDKPTDANRLPTGANLRSRIPEWLKKAESGDTVIVFYAGHGFLDDRGQGVLAARDCEREHLGLTGVRTDDIRNLLHHCKASQKLLVLDCCHAGGAQGPGPPPPQGAHSLSRPRRPIALLSLLVGEPPGEPPRPPDFPLRPVFDKARGLITLASCGRSQWSREWDAERHGLFTFFLVQGLAGAADTDRNGIVDSDELFRYTYEEVTTTAKARLKAKQTPVRIINEDVEGVFARARVGRPMVRHALLIGLGSYKDRKLRYAETDILSFKNQLLKGGYDAANVGMVVDEPGRPATRQVILEALKRLTTVTSPEDGILIVFKGHSRTIGGRSYLVPADSDGTARTCIDLREVYDMMRAPPARSKVLVIDALAEDARADAGPSGAEAPGGAFVIAPPPPGVTVMINQVNDVPAEDEQLRQGVFFHFLSEGFGGRADSNSDGRLSFDELYAYTREETIDYYRAHRPNVNVRGPMRVINNFVAGVEILAVVRPSEPLLRGRDLRSSAEFQRYIAAHDRDLSGVDLRGADLSGVDLSGVVLKRARLEGATLIGTKLSRADLSDADLGSATLIRADLSEADLRGATFIEADLSSADLFTAHVTNANFTNAYLDQARLAPAMKGD
jgi:uncharacterized caspase-like protein